VNETVQQISLDMILPNPDNRRVGGFDPVKLQQLADSIRDVGVQQPIIVREALISQEGLRFELVAGERRWRAAKLAGLTEIPAIMRELDDLQVLKVQTIENLQREDVHPLDEADGFARLIDKAGYEVEQIAQELGKSASYVYQRLKLRDLVPQARKLLVDGTIAAGHAILIARLPSAQQDRVIKRGLSDFVGRVQSVHELGDWIQREVLMDLSKAPWKRDDANLLPAAGPCTLCPKRTGSQPALFADVSNGSKKDYCTDGACFAAKGAAVVEQKRAELKDKPHLEVLGDGIDYQEREKLLKKKGILEKYNVQMCKKGDKGAQPALVVAGDGQGRILYAKPESQRSTYRYQPSAKEIAEQKRRKEQEKRDSIIKRALWDAVMAEVGGLIKEGAWSAELDRFIVRRFWERLWDDARGALCKAEGWPVPEKKKGEYGRPWEQIGETAIASADSDDLQLLMVKIALAGELLGGYWSANRDDERALNQVAKLLKIDAKKIEAKATAELQKPKGPKLVNVSADGKASAKKKAKAGTCRVCGCTDNRACKGGCSWVDKTHTLCSTCAEKKDPEYLDMLDQGGDKDLEE